jgi:hypothetical protein
MLILSEFTLTQRRPRRNQRQRTDPTSVECNPQPPAGGASRDRARIVSDCRMTVIISASHQRFLHALGLRRFVI